jgi:hypothetical protein
MARFRLLVAVGILVLGGGSFQTHAQSPDDVAMAKQLVGMWRLVSNPMRSADGTTRQSRLSKSYIIYTDTKPVRMCYVATDPNRPKWNSETAPTESEAISGAVNGSYSYCSTVEIHAKEGFVIHHVEIASVPNHIDRNWKRWVTFEGPNRVSLRIDPPELQRGTFPALATAVESTLIWERVQ